MQRIAIPILTLSGVWTTILVLSVVVVGQPFVVGIKGRDIEGVFEVVVVEVFVVVVVVVITFLFTIAVSAVVIVVFSVTVVHASVVVTTVVQSQEQSLKPVSGGK